tara:strand:+ start:341 stop:475 length:135 start_codon:yes stop_codon:yes gene_type:complete
MDAIRTAKAVSLMVDKILLGKINLGVLMIATLLKVGHQLVKISV